MIVPAPLSDVLDRTFLSNSLRAWLTAGVTTTVMFLVLLVLRSVLHSRIGKIAARTVNQFDDMIVELLAETRKWVLFVISLLAGTHTLYLGRATTWIDRADHLVLLWQIAIWGVTGVSFWTKHHLETQAKTDTRSSVAMITAISVAAKVMVWALIFTTALYTVWDINPASLITTLGVSGIAIALAVQNILGDILAALAIVFDKPFDVGDSIGVDTLSGTVEHIGLKTTRIRSTTGEQIILGNGDLLKSRLRNYRRMSQRRVMFNLDVPFDTPNELLARIPSMLQAMVTAQSPVQFDRSHVASFTESGIRLETVYFVLDPDYKLYMDIQQNINLEILKQFNAENLKFALPSRTVYHEGPNAKDLAVGTQPQTAADGG
ncbi:MAG TPA: mechanosensitive ion channel family protein [Gemmatimonadaceae bacterium]|jgi:small-conductance mechanosensitive channel